jgi:hypothetical protein
LQEPAASALFAAISRTISNEAALDINANPQRRMLGPESAAIHTKTMFHDHPINRLKFSAGAVFRGSYK